MLNTIHIPCFFHELNGVRSAAANAFLMDDCTSTGAAPIRFSIAFDVFGSSTGGAHTGARLLVVVVGSECVVFVDSTESECVVFVDTPESTVPFAVVVVVVGKRDSVRRTLT